MLTAAGADVEPLNAGGCRPMALLDWSTPVSTIRGHHNLNIIVGAHDDVIRSWGVVARGLVKVRKPLVGVPKVVPRGWQDEAAVLRVINRAVARSPQALARVGDYSVHTFAPGVVLSKYYPIGRRIPAAYIEQIIEVFAALAALDTSLLPPASEKWGECPDDGDSTEFLRRLVRFTEEEVHLQNRPGYGTLFDALQVPRNAMDRFWETVPELTKRPFGLLHTDIHRDNLVIQDGRNLFLLDWELAIVGDPVHDLATHLCRMRYPKDQWTDVVRRWEVGVGQVNPDAVVGLKVDLDVFVDYERVQSLYPDIIRAANSLTGVTDPGSRQVTHAAASVRRALKNALPLLGVMEVPTTAKIRRALMDWWRLNPIGPPPAV